MTTGSRIRRLVLLLALAAPLGLASANAAGAERARETAAGGHSDAYVPPAPRDDPRLRHTGDTERTLRQAGDLVFSRPIHFVRLVAGVAMLPVALPVAAVLADWHDALDFCVKGPYGMVFQRPLGE